ncbi:PAS domain S-box protein [Mariprofundus sp. NF]|uniref:PAS domain S-box protein n=1 Tax=Mariprofundus sp. NF TaxID=2608716 RepID=UPI0015A2A269|nr:PAS domain S-box protein [Mariprofundus sp. NF]NWF39693.1 PAS domain S-box protein [Mariprofundus sp. NF]
MKEIINQLASHDLLQDIVEGVPIRIFWKDREGKFLGCNSLVARDAGLTSPDELIGKSDFDMAWHEQAEAFRADDLKVMESGTPKLAFEEPLTSSDGQTIWLRTSKVPLRDHEKNIIGILGAYEDITAEKEQQTALKNSERVLKNIFNSLQDAYYCTDIEGRVVMVSPSAEKLMACQRGDLLNKTIADFYVHPEQREKFLDALRKGGGIVNNFEAQIRRVDGEIIWVSTNAHYFRDEQGNVTGVEGTIRDVTQPKQQEEELKLAKFVLDHAPLNITYLDSDARIRYINKTGCETLGYTQQELLQMSIPDIDPLFPMAVWDEHWQDLKQNISIPLETEHQRKNGERFPIEVIANYMEFGDKAYNVAFDRDITDSKQKQAALQESEARFRGLFNNSPDPCWIINEENMFTLCNQAAADILGYDSIEELSSIHPSKLSPELQPDGRESFEKANAMMAAAHANGIHRFEWEHLRKNGESFPVEITLAQIEFGGKKQLYCIWRDITESRRQQQLLETSQRRFSMLFDSSSDGLFIIDMQGDFIDINRTAYERLGYTKDEMMSMRLTELDPPEFAARVPERLEQIIKHGMATFETAHYRKDGSIMPVEINARIIELDGERVFFSVIRDISERKKLEEQLRQAQKMEAIGTLVGGIAHDFNNMLAAIQGNVYLATKQMQDHPVAADKLANIEKLGARAADMVQQLLTFARKDNVAMRLFSLNGFMDDGYQLAKTLIPENIDHQTRTCSQQLYIKGDATQMQQVLMNLLNNAVDALTEVEKPMIRCSLEPFAATRSFKSRHPELKASHFACITVKDNGHGIPGELMDKVFEPFFTTKEIGKGTGLGLAMLYGAVQTHHGAVEIDSRVGKGTTFRVYLPLTEEEQITESDNKNEITTIEAGRTILLVDDEESVRNTTSEVLSSMGYRVLEAENGEVAMQFFKENQDRIDLIITDVIMPRMGGVELFKAVRLLDEAMPVILVTGYDKDHVLDKGIEMKHALVLNKPFDFDELNRSIQANIK